MRLTAVGIAMLIMLSGCVTDESPVGSTPVPSPTATLNSPTASPTSTSQSTKRPPSKPRRTSVTVVMNGDLLWHNTLWYGAREDAQRRGHGGYDFAPLLAGMKPVIASADLAICHEEVPLARPGGPYRNFPLVRRAAACRASHFCHWLRRVHDRLQPRVDQGFAGLKRTLDELDRAKIAHVGTARSKSEARAADDLHHPARRQDRDRRGHLQPERPPHAAGQAMGRAADERQESARSGASCSEQPEQTS